MKLESAFTGRPVVDGLYVVFVPAVVSPWLEPHIVTWHKGGWFHRWSSQPYQDEIHFFAGPIPVVRFDGFPCPNCGGFHDGGCPLPIPSTEYDL